MSNGDTMVPGRPGPLKVLHCPTTTGGNPQGLAKAERRIGLDSRSIAFTQNYLAYHCDEVLWCETDPIWIQQYRSAHLLWRAWLEFDVVHYNSGTSIMPWSFSERWARQGSPKWWVYKAYERMCRTIERTLLRKKVVAVTFQGDDARQGDYSSQHFEFSIASETGDSYYTAASDERTRRRIAWFDEYADLIYAVKPDLLWVLPKRARFIPYAHLDIENWIPLEKISSDTPTVIHAPSHRGAKGTAYILDAVRQLKAEGLAFEFILVENLSNAEARKLYERADLVIDQLLAGWYGGFAVEAMALGKPVICYLRESDLRFLPQAMCADLPLINARPDTVTDVLREWLTARRVNLRSKGLDSRRFVENWHDPIRIARDIHDDYARIARQKGLAAAAA